MNQYNIFSLTLQKGLKRALLSAFSCYVLLCYRTLVTFSLPDKTQANFLRKMCPTLWRRPARRGLVHGSLQQTKSLLTGDWWDRSFWRGPPHNPSTAPTPRLFSPTTTLTGKKRSHGLLCESPLSELGLLIGKTRQKEARRHFKNLTPAWILSYCVGHLTKDDSVFPGLQCSSNMLLIGCLCCFEISLSPEVVLFCENKATEQHNF